MYLCSLSPGGKNGLGEGDKQFILFYGKALTRRLITELLLLLYIRMRQRDSRRVPVCPESR